MSETILHITSREAWSAAQKSGQYTAAEFDKRRIYSLFDTCTGSSGR